MQCAKMQPFLLSLQAYFFTLTPGWASPISNNTALPASITHHHHHHHASITQHHSPSSSSMYDITLSTTFCRLLLLRVRPGPKVRFYELLVQHFLHARWHPSRCQSSKGTIIKMKCDENCNTAETPIQCIVYLSKQPCSCCLIHLHSV